MKCGSAWKNYTDTISRLVDFRYLYGMRGFLEQGNAMLPCCDNTSADVREVTGEFVNW